MTPKKFRALVWRYYHVYGRHDLPWRPTSLKATKGTTDDILYRILVSEVMLQQTQVDRVIPLYKSFIKKFPTAKKLSIAPLSEVLKAWQGLGYNRRAKLLREAAHSLVNTASPRTRFNLVAELEKLPGVGPYTARAVAAFAHNQDVIIVETNIRTAIIHHFFLTKKKVSDADIEKVLIQVLPKGKSREWQSALMDYGAHLKRLGISHNAKSEGYAKQSKFTGSLREARGTILRVLTEGSVSRMRLSLLFGATRESQMEEALDALCSEGLLCVEKGHCRLVD